MKASEIEELETVFDGIFEYISVIEMRLDRLEKPKQKSTPKNKRK